LEKALFYITLREAQQHTSTIIMDITIAILVIVVQAKRPCLGKMREDHSITITAHLTMSLAHLIMVMVHCIMVTITMKNMEQMVRQKVEERLAQVKIIMVVVIIIILLIMVVVIMVVVPVILSIIVLVVSMAASMNLDTVVIVIIIINNTKVIKRRGEWRVLGKVLEVRPSQVNMVVSTAIIITITIAFTIAITMNLIMVATILTIITMARVPVLEMRKKGKKEK